MVKKCHDCGVKEGQLHLFGCDMERCPFCGKQLLSCPCIYKQLNIYDSIKYTSKTNFLPEEVYSNGVTDAQSEKWYIILEKKGRSPYIVYPNICAKCGALWPDFNTVSNIEWEHYIQPDMQNAIICQECYSNIKNLIDEEAFKRKETTC